MKDGRKMVPLLQLICNTSIPNAKKTIVDAVDGQSTYQQPIR